MSTSSLIPDWIENYLNLSLSFAFMVLLPWELMRRFRAGKLTRESVLELLASTSPLVLTILTSGLALTFIAALFSFAARFAVGHIETTWVSAAAAIVLVDLLYYFDHRCGHTVRIYWAVSHSVHHSSDQYDQTTGFRISFIDGFLSPWFYVPAVLIGFSPPMVAAALGFVIAYQQWIHTDCIGKLKWLDPWLNTPSNHRVHHGSQAHYLDKNYGAVLMIWDRLCGSYQAEDEPSVFGLTQPIQSRNPWHVHVCELLRLIGDLKNTNRWKDRLKYAFNPPGWQPCEQAIVHDTHRIGRE